MTALEIDFDFFEVNNESGYQGKNGENKATNGYFCEIGLGVVKPTHTIFVRKMLTGGVKFTVS